MNDTRARLEAIKQRFDQMANIRPMNEVLWMLVDAGYTMREIRFAHTEWVEEK